MTSVMKKDLAILSRDQDILSRDQDKVVVVGHIRKSSLTVETICLFHASPESDPRRQIFLRQRSLFFQNTAGSTFCCSKDKIVGIIGHKISQIP
jgi:hypothetical protein